MAVIDPSTNVGRIRLATGDTRDIAILPDSVIEQVLADNNDNLRTATIICAQYILATLAFDGHSKMGIVEIWGSDIFNQYMRYLTMLVKDPNLNMICPIPYSASGDKLHPILQFQQDFQCGYTGNK